MKPLYYFSFLVLFGMGTFAGCSSNTSANNSNSAGSNGLSAAIDGTSWSPDVPAHAIYTSFLNQTAITASSTKGQSMGLTFKPGIASAGTYKVSDMDSVSGVYVIQSPMKSYTAVRGSVTVSSWTSSHMTGTFNMVVKNLQNVADSSVITSGNFDLDITKS